MSGTSLNICSKFRLSVLAVFILAVLLLSVACNKTVVKQPAPEKVVVIQETKAVSDTPEQKTREIIVSKQVTIDVYQTAGDDWTETSAPSIRRAKYTQTQETKVKDRVATAIDTIAKTKIEARQIQGFRVQLANVSGEDEANWIKEQASALFDSVYVIFQRPNYKVRGGNFSRRAHADAVADSAKVIGFKDAWVVPSRVWQVKNIVSTDTD